MVRKRSSLLDGLLDFAASVWRGQGRGGRRAGPAHEGGADRLEVPSCPVCGKVMVWRVEREGARAGNAFWRCAAYPECKGTREAH